MQAINRYQLEQLHLPVDGYMFTVKTITSIDGGQNFYYCGNSRYFKTEAKTAAYKAEQEGKADADFNHGSYQRGNRENDNGSGISAGRSRSR